MAIVGIGIRVLDVAVLGPADDPVRRPRPKILLPLGRIRGDHVKARRRKRPRRFCCLESLERRASGADERRYGEQQARAIQG